MFTYSTTTVAIFVAIINFIVNASVLTVTVTSKRLRGDVVTGIISSLAVSDLCFGTFVPFACALLNLTQTNKIPVGLEGVLGTCYQVFGTCSLFHISFVAFVKCSVIAKPLDHFAVLTDRVIVASLLGIWLASALLGSMPAIVGARFRFDPEVCLPSTVTYEVLQASITASCFVVSATVVIILYAKVFLIVRRQLCAITASVPTGWAVGKPVIAGRKTPDGITVSTSEMVSIGGMVPTVKKVSEEAAVREEAVVVVERGVHIEGTVLATRTVPTRVLCEDNTVEQRKGPAEELSMKADPNSVHYDVATKRAVTGRMISKKGNAMSALIEEENFSGGNYSKGIIVKRHSGAGNQLEVVQRGNCNNEAVDFVNREQSAEDISRNLTGDIASREVAPVKAIAKHAIHEQKALGEKPVKGVSFATSKTDNPIIVQPSALGKSIRSAKNLFIISGVYMITYIPALLTIMKVMDISQELRFPIKVGVKWTHVTASTFNGLLYIVLHRSVRAELVRLFCRRRRPMARELQTASRTTKVSHQLGSHDNPSNTTQHS